MTAVRLTKLPKIMPEATKLQIKVPKQRMQRLVQKKKVS